MSSSGSIGTAAAEGLATRPEAKTATKTVEKNMERNMAASPSLAKNELWRHSDNLYEARNEKPRAFDLQGRRLVVQNKRQTKTSSQLLISRD